MKLYIDIKLMTFNEDNLEHKIIMRIDNKEFLGYDLIIDLPDDDKFIKDTYKVEYKKDKDDKDTEEIKSEQFEIREKNTWWSFPLYQITNGKIISFDYTKYQYFVDTNRRMGMAFKINDLYNPSSEAKILRKTLKYIMDELSITYPNNFKKYNDKVEVLINKNPKGEENG